MNRPTDYEGMVTAVGDEVVHIASVVKSDLSEVGLRNALVLLRERLAALLPPAKERVPWWEAKGRTVDARVVTRATDEAGGPGVWVRDSESMSPVLSERHVHADPDGMVEVDAR